MFDYARLVSRITSLEKNRGAILRFGKITEISSQDCTARVQLQDADNMVTKPLKILQNRTLQDQVQCLPDLGETCACLFAGQGFEQGVILGSLYTPQVPAPAKNTELDYKRYADGTELYYDRTKHKLTINVQGEINIECQNELKIKAPKLEIKGELIIKKGSIKIEAGDLLASNISSLNHRHSGVEAGSDSSGTPFGE